MTAQEKKILEDFRKWAIECGHYPIPALMDMNSFAGIGITVIDRLAETG